MRAKFGFDVFGIDASFGGPVVVEITVCVDERGHIVPGSDGTPAIVDALASQR